MTLQLTEDEFIQFLASPKFISGALKYKGKDANHHLAQAVVRCPKFPEINMRVVSQYHVSRIPRKFSISLLCDNYTVLRLDVNPGRIHTNVLDLEKVKVPGSHWHIYPNTSNVIADGIVRTHQQWMADFLIQANITIDGGYSVPTFEVENVQLNLLGGGT